MKKRSVPVLDYERQWKVRWY